MKASGLLGAIPRSDALLNIYKSYLKQTSSITEEEKILLFRFMHEMIGCVNLQWKDAALSSARYSEVVSQSDETMGFFVLQYYGDVPPENGRAGAEKKQKLSGKRLSDGIVWFNNTSKWLTDIKAKYTARVQDLDNELHMYITKRAQLHTNRSSAMVLSHSVTKQRAKEALDNLHDFSKLFGRKDNIYDHVGQREEV
ncbi:MAG TPA: hypothetical protein VIQ31_15250 [Phormidium sp.]